MKEGEKKQQKSLRRSYRTLQRNISDVIEARERERRGELNYLSHLQSWKGTVSKLRSSLFALEMEPCAAGCANSLRCIRKRAENEYKGTEDLHLEWFTYLYICSKIQATITFILESKTESNNYIFWTHDDYLSDDGKEILNNIVICEPYRLDSNVTQNQQSNVQHWNG